MTTTTEPTLEDFNVLARDIVAVSKVRAEKPYGAAALALLDGQISAMTNCLLYGIGQGIYGNDSKPTRTVYARSPK